MARLETGWAASAESVKTAPDNMTSEQQRKKKLVFLVWDADETHEDLKIPESTLVFWFLSPVNG